MVDGQVKILFVNNARNRGGGEEFLRDLLSGLIPKGVEIGLVCRPGTPLESLFHGMPVTVYPIDKSGLRGISSCFRIAKIVRDDQYEIISIQRGHDIVQSWIAALLSRRRPVLVHTVHIADFIRSRFLLGRLHGIVAISRHIYQRLVGFSSALSDRLTVIHNGIDLALFDRSKKKRGFIRTRFGLSMETPLVSTVGLMWKNQISFLDSLVAIKKKIPGVKYLLLTTLNGIPQIQEFRDRAAELGLADSLLWLNVLPKEDMPAYYSDIDVAVNTFPNEGFGLWVVEALAMGTPVVSVDEGGVRDVLEGCPAARLIRTGAEDMTEAVIRIFTDPKTRARMSEAGPKWVAERFSREQMAARYYHYFDSLLHGKSSPADGESVCPER